MVPAAAAVTRPAVLIVATDAAELLHVPPAVASESVAVVPMHSADGPLIAAGVAYTVTTAVTVAPPYE